MKKFLVLFVLLASLYSNAAEVDTVSVYSASMKRNLKCVVIRPDSYKKTTLLYPVVYLLHGYSGDYSNWIKKVPALKIYADNYQVLIVCPEGGYSSWYFDSPVDSTLRYETFTAREVPSFIDAGYRTIKSRDARAISGLSMGGHGALFIAFRHADTFGAAGSMSGLADLQHSANRYDIAKRIGDSSTHPSNWINYSVMNVVGSYPQDSLQLIIDCGTDDPFIRGNRILHEKMLQLKIPHEYIERPGKHDWNYWTNAVLYHLHFFNNYFNRSRYSGKK